MNRLLLTAAFILPLVADTAQASEWFQLIGATQTTPYPDTCTKARDHDRNTAASSPAALVDDAHRHNVQANINDLGNDEVDVITTDRNGNVTFRFFHTIEACDSAAKIVRDEQAEVDKYRAGQWYGLVRGKNSADPDTCINRLPLANPALARDFYVRNMFDSRIDDIGNDEVDVIFTDKDGDVTLRFFRTSEACDTAAKAVKDEQAANDKYR